MKQDTVFPIAQRYFDVVCMSNVLFNMEKTLRNFMLKQCLKLIRMDGKLLVLSPTGKGKFSEFASTMYNLKNKGFVLWYLLTKSRAKAWNADDYLESFCNHRQLVYHKTTVFNGFGLLEIIERPSFFPPITKHT